ncbi:MAG TPA: hypothetical protein VJW20_10900 [Candidatus Angelobacter sp.]|nr:hypothetical protein [Candidatus Angelobacter sp.]
MRRSRNVYLAGLSLLLLAVAGFLFYQCLKAGPPAAARLLPEGDLLIYANFKPIHLFDLGKSGPVELEGDYKDFVVQTGIQFERDLDEVAISRRDTPDHLDVESSEIFAGRFDANHLKTYLQKIADSTEQYRNHTIYSISHEGHLVRASLLDDHRVAVTNMVSPEPMHGIIDHSYKSTSGPSLLSGHYRDVPATSLAWLIDRIPNKPDNIELPGGFAITLPGDAVAVASLRYTGSLLFRADVFAQSETQARQIVDAANTHLALVRSIGQFVGRKGNDKDVKAAFDSIQVEQKENVATLTATIPQSVLKKIWSEVKEENTAPQQLPKR